MSDMPEDLRWIAEHVSQWPDNYLSVDLVINDSVRPYGKCCNYFESRTEGKYAKPEWLQARKDLGLIMSDEEEEIPAQEWAGSVPEGVMVDDMGNEYHDDHGERSLYGEIKEGFESMQHDNVNKPKHYQLREGYEVYDLRQDLAAKAANGGATYAQYSDWDRAIEYIIRMWGKNRLEDAKKGRWYLDKLIEKLEERELNQ